MKARITTAALCLASVLAIAACTKAGGQRSPATAARPPAFRDQPLVSDIYTADPSAHVFGGKIYVYPSHDIATPTPDDDLGNQYAMRDYRVLSMDKVGGKVTVGPVALDVKDVPWASQQMWAPDAAYKDGTYLPLFPGARQIEGQERPGRLPHRRGHVESPMGPFVAEKEPIPGSFSMDPAVFVDDDGTAYMYFGGIWGGQLQRWATQYDPNGSDTDLKQDDKPALSGKVVRMNPDMKTFAEAPRDAVILGEDGKPVTGGDHERRFFEASWVFRKDGKYYYTYSTGDTHFLNYAIGTSPYGPFRYAGHILKPVQGWTTHHSIIQHDGKWWLFYADTQLSNKNHLRNVKVTELTFNPDGTIQTIDPMKAK
jgi:hypothetical protein